MSSLRFLQEGAEKVEAMTRSVLADLPDGTPQDIRTRVEVIATEAHLTVMRAEHLRTSIRAQVDA